MLSTFPLDNLVTLAAGKINYTQELQNLLGELSNPWVVFGFAAQAVFACRFVVQWIASERRGYSFVPIAFWYLSLLGTSMLAIYAIYRKDVVFIAGQTLNIGIYLRNLWLIYYPKNPAPPAGV